MGVSVSVMLDDSEDLKEGDKTIYDWIRENNLDRVKEILPHEDVNKLDENVGVMNSQKSKLKQSKIYIKHHFRA